MTWLDTTHELVKRYVEDVRRTLRELDGKEDRQENAGPITGLPQHVSLTPQEIVTRLRPLSLVLETTDDCDSPAGICQTCPRLPEVSRAREVRCRLGRDWAPVGVDPSAVSQALDEVNAPITVLAGGEVTLRTDILAISLKHAVERGSVVFLLTNSVDIEAKFERHRALFGNYPVFPHDNLVIQFSTEGFDDLTMACVRGEHARGRLEQAIAFVKKLGFAATNLAANVTINHTVARHLDKIVTYLEGVGVRWTHILPIYPTPFMDSALALTEEDRLALAEDALRLKRSGAGILNSEGFFEFVGGAIRPLCFPLGAAVLMPQLGHPPSEAHHAVGEGGRRHLLRCLVPGRFKPGCYYADFDDTAPNQPLGTYAELRQAIGNCPNLSSYVERSNPRCRGCYVYCTFDIPGVSELVLARDGAAGPSRSVGHK